MGWKLQKNFDLLVQNSTEVLPIAKSLGVK